MTAEPAAGPILVAGIGNVFLGDDGFGVEVAARLATRSLPPHVRVADFGIRGMDLAYALMEPGLTAVLVDAVRRGGTPGTVYVLEIRPGDPRPEPGGPIETHGMHPARVLELVAALGGTPGRVFLVGCEPEPSSPELELHGRMGLSEPVAAAVDGAVDAVLSLIARIGTEIVTPAHAGA